MNINAFLRDATRIVFFTGKGGVGKTSLSCATALSLARRGKTVLLVSTDPASNLDEVLGTTLNGEPTPVPGVSGLFALNIDPQSAAASYRERVVGPYRGVLPAAAVASMEEQLSGACTVEIAAFDQFTKLLGSPEATASFDHIIFDTAPTGHTIRLLNLPAAWTGFISTNTTGTSCLGPLAGLESQKHLYAASLQAIADGTMTTLALVARPEQAALVELERTRKELAALGMHRQVLFVNGMFTAKDRADEVATALEARGITALNAMPAELSVLPRVDVPLAAIPPTGISGLTSLLADESLDSRPDRPAPTREWPSLAELIEQIGNGGPGVVLTMGKGGVGKTTIAAAVAIALADRGFTVHLSTTDPAAHVLETVSGVVPGLRISRIDPVAETSRYTAEVLAESGRECDAQALALLEEDLRSPCTEEIAVFRAFAELIAARDTDFVVLDTAPTGHTLLLLDAAEAYHREVSRKLTGIPDSVRSLLPRLRDPALTRVLLITLPEATPVHEAARLQEDLRRAGIGTYAWIVNQSFAASATRDLLLRRKASLEVPYIEEVETALSQRISVLPWRPEEPVGPERLRQLTRATTRKELVNQ